jgi:hypothetical protein
MFWILETITIVNTEVKVVFIANDIWVWRLNNYT